ncbi:MAG TPA: helix-turn-helix transcriptional regulator, partial [Candidatus Acidoferrum sp.]
RQCLNIICWSMSMSTENVDLITPAQCRGGRGLLGMTQPALASAANLGLSTIVDFERSRRSVSSEAVKMIRRALEQAGIEFIDENGGGPGVRLRTSQRPKQTK